MDLNARIARRLRQLREDHGWSLEALAERSGVSRSNISLIERGQSSPTATVLDRLSAGLGVTVASLFEEPATGSTVAPSPLSRAADQPTWRDPASGYVRRNLSPAALGQALQLVAVEFPAGGRVAFETVDRLADVQQQVWLMQGRLQIHAEGRDWTLEPGDCLGFALTGPTLFHNPGPEPARYLVALTGASTLPPGRRSGPHPGPVRPAGAP